MQSYKEIAVFGVHVVWMIIGSRSRLNGVQVGWGLV